MTGMCGVFGDLPRLTSPFASGISHAHAGLAELRPPPPSTVLRPIADVASAAASGISRVLGQGTARFGTGPSFNIAQAR
jgi:hypothetical protein